MNQLRYLNDRLREPELETSGCMLPRGQRSNGIPYRNDTTPMKFAYSVKDVTQPKMRITYTQPECYTLLF